MGSRAKLDEFWNDKAGDPTVKTMMLNKDADKIDDSDRNNVLSGLPDFSNMRIIELGSGIGRFTQFFAPKAKSVYATDLVESFIVKNKELNGKFANCEFHVETASAIEREPSSADLVFSNWLLMYLTDSEVINFLKNVLNWLKVDGYFHFRESCSESSKRTDTNESGANSSNPTHYRHICQYINLLNKIIAYDEGGNKRFGFQILWAKSIPTYIEMFNNWRQVQMLIKKVELNTTADYCNGVANGIDPLLHVLTDDTLREQEDFNKNFSLGLKIWNGRTPFSKFLLQALEDFTSNMNKMDNGVLNIVGNPNFSVSPFEIAEVLNCSVVGVETCAYSYNKLLAEANEKCNKKVSLNWLQRLDTENDWSLPTGSFNRVVGCRLLKSVENRHQFLLKVKSYLKSPGYLFLLEEVDAKEEDTITKCLQNTGFDQIEMIDITVDIQRALSKAASASLQALNRQSTLYESVAKSALKWVLIKAAVK